MSHPHNLHLVEFQAFIAEHGGFESVWLNPNTIASLRQEVEVANSDEEYFEVTLVNLSDDRSLLILDDLHTNLTRLQNLGANLHRPYIGKRKENQS